MVTFPSAKSDVEYLCQAGLPESRNFLIFFNHDFYSYFCITELWCRNQSLWGLN